MSFQLSNAQIAMILLAALAIWRAITSAGTLSTMDRAGTPSTPQGALGQQVINSVIKGLTLAVVGLCLVGVIYIYLRQPALPFPHLYVRLVPPEVARSAVSYPPLYIGGEAEVVSDEGLPLYRADEAGQPTDILKAQLWQGQVMTVIGGPSEWSGRYQWRVRTRDGVEGWAPLRTPAGALGLAPR
ncbi:MAG: hypothetical protein KIT87_18965 [Anaerolineae bacterium]|nr:hypothetical protein [Anaerolineae bacterium]